ncbi:MAG: type II toxin-antitoxin system RelE/ParE family toxin [Cyanothece sp. SIO2G6]|nr:type II toxin-antitoxin system RelE/ParE family toxin [Cyanothece sp. SIO2G6]
MPTDPSLIQIALTPRFQKELRILAKRYRHIRSDLQSLIQDLEAGNLPGEQISGVKLPLFKVRVKNSDIQKGKSAGYRVIYYLKTQSQIILVTIYAKSDTADVDLKTLRDAIKQYERQFNDE